MSLEIKYNTEGGKLTLEANKLSVHTYVSVAEAMIEQARRLMEDNGVELNGDDRAAHEDVDSWLTNIEDHFYNLDAFINNTRSECAFYYAEEK